MLRLRGKSIATGMSLGSAAIFQAPNGIPMLPAHLIAHLSRARQDAPIEPMDVVLVVKNFSEATMFAMPWIKVVGIVSEEMIQDIPSVKVPVVAGVSELMQSISDDALVLVDGDRGLVLIDPDSMAIATYQAERENIQPRRRFYLDYSHLPALTLDGREIRVMARVNTTEDVNLAHLNGADTIVLSCNCPLFSSEMDDQEQYHALKSLCEAFPGKPVTLIGYPDSASIESLLRASALCDLTYALPLNVRGEYFTEFTEAMKVAEELLLAENTRYGYIRLAGITSILDELDEALETYPIGRILVDQPYPGAFQSEPGLEWLDKTALYATRMLAPLELIIPVVDTNNIHFSLGIGASGFIVTPDYVQSLKALLREMNTVICRNELTNRSVTD